MQKLPKMKISQTRGVKNTREATHVGFVTVLGLCGPTARHGGDYIADSFFTLVQSTFFKLYLTIVSLFVRRH